MTAEPPGQDRCPKCSAAVRLGDPWCTLCYADLRPPAPEPPPPPPPPAVPPPYDPLSDPLAMPSPVTSAPDPLAAPRAVAGPTWPCATCGAVNPMAHDTCDGCGSPFLSGLREQQGPLLELPVVGDITQLGRGQRFALAGGVVLTVILLTLLLGLLFG